MKAYCILGPKQTGWRDLPIPEIGPLDALVKLTAISPCTSDVHIVETLPPEFTSIVGCALGHEGAGIVEAVGSEVKDFKKGDRVVIPGVIANWRSKMAQENLSQYDPSNSYSLRLEQGGGTFAEYCFVMDADMNLGRIPEKVTDTQAVLATDMMATAFTAIEQANIQLGDTVAVLGIGPVGLMSICGAQLSGASRIFAIGSRKACFDVAEKYGASDLINYKDGNPADQILELTGGEGVDVVLVSGGDADVIATSLKMLKVGGTLSNVALFFGDENTVIPNQYWGYGALDFKTITGVGLRGGRYYMERLMRLIEYGKVKPEYMVSHLYHGIDSLEEAFTVMSNKTPDLIKPVILVD